MFDPNLKAIEEEDYDKAKKRIMITSVIALILYAALTGWRYESTGRLKEDLEAGDTIVGSEVTEFFASSVWLEANYGVVFAVAVFTFFFALFGVYAKSHEMASFLCCCSGCCSLVTVVFIGTTLVVGPLCATGVDCSERQGRQAGTAILLLCILATYTYLWYWSYKLYRTKAYFAVEGTFNNVEFTPPPPHQTSNRTLQPTASPQTVSLEEVPYAIPVPQT